MSFRVRVRSALQAYGSGLDWIDRRAIAIMRRSTDSLGAPLSLLIASVIVAIITIPKKKTSSPNVKEKRKAGTRAGLTKAAIVAAAAKLIESVGANGFSLVPGTIFRSSSLRARRQFFRGITGCLWLNRLALFADPSCGEEHRALGPWMEL